MSGSETVVLRDGGLTKTLLRAGTGPRPEPGNTCSIHYDGTLDDGSVFDSTHRRTGKPLEFKLGLCEVIKGLDICVSEMRVGEKAALQIPAMFAYGDQPPKYSTILPGADLTFIVELLYIRDDSMRTIKRQLLMAILFTIIVVPGILFLQARGY